MFWKRTAVHLLEDMGSSGVGVWVVQIFVISSCIVLFCGVTTRELRRKVACGEHHVTLECGNRSVIAVHAAVFSSNDTEENVTCPAAAEQEEDAEQLKREEEERNSTCTEDVRISLNRRCSGLNQCNYSYSLNPEKSCDSREGVLIIQYDCVRDSSINRYCNVRLHPPEGYIASPGYPQYYPRLSSCNWTVQSGDGQTVLLRLLHVHVRLPRKQYGRELCDDSVTLLEGSTKRLVACGEALEFLQHIEADGSNRVVVQFSSEDFFPASGFLLYYKLLGCPTLPPPEEGYLVHRNGSTAVYVCCKNHLFNDTLENSRTLHCTEDHQWNDTIAPCSAIEELRRLYANHSMELDFGNMTKDEGFPVVLEAKGNYMEDILIPSILMGILLLGNAIIVTIIIRIRMKSKAKHEIEDEDLSPQRSTPLVAEATEV